MLDHFDLVIAQDMARDTAATARLLNKTFPMLTFPDIHSTGAKNAGHYTKPALTDSQIRNIRDKTLMDKVLYEYAKVLHQRSLGGVK